MENTSPDSQAYPPPPPPPPARSHRGLWTALAVVGVILVLAVLGVVVYEFRAQIPIVSGLFPTPTLTSRHFSNTAAGISLDYPADWKYTQSGSTADGYAIVVASTQDILDNLSNIPTTGAGLLVQTQSMSTSDFTFTVDSSSMTRALDYIASQFSNFSSEQDIHAFTLSGYPAASGVYTATNTSQPNSTIYLTAILRDKEIILVFAICPQAEWTQYQPVLDGILQSMVIVEAK